MAEVLKVWVLQVEVTLGDGVGGDSVHVAVSDTLRLCVMVREQVPEPRRLDEGEKDWEGDPEGVSVPVALGVKRRLPVQVWVVVGESERVVVEVGVLLCVG